MIRLRPALLAALAALVLLPAHTKAQTLQLRRAVPDIAWGGCPSLAPEAAGSVRSEEAERLAAQATQAAILGDNDAAFELLVQAAALDPNSPSITYRLARTVEELGRRDQAVQLYCRYVGLAPEGSDAAEVRQRLEALTRATGFAVPAEAATAFRTGVEHYDAQRFAAAEAAFGQALAAAPAWSDALFDRGLARLAAGDEPGAGEDLRRFLEMRPDAGDFDAVLDLLATLRGPPPRPYSPGTALAAGLVVPGLGHFTTGRAGRGVLALGAAAGAVAAGLMVKEVDVQCLTIPVGGACPPGQILGEEVRRPYLAAGVAGALAVGVLAAIDAYRGAVAGNRLAAEAFQRGSPSEEEGLSLVPPALLPVGSGARLELIRLRFR